ncbi:hypothetical protein BKA62DRAFT_661070 [Auriculariales sp. MPI-PUGE-AT-0066]|nr:hypothetical protein BKA62DRAFT_661070 [Auriculariales sp. MPI-PUGE-AT-0066]
MVIPGLSWLLDQFWLVFTIIVGCILTALYTVVLRARVNYAPNEIVLGGIAPNGITGFFDMARRVSQMEGIMGFLTGTWPLYAIFFFRSTIGNSFLWAILPTIVTRLFFFILEIPVIITVNRTITTHHTISIFDPVGSFKALYTPYERSKLWIIFFTPGVLFAEFLHLGFLIGLLLPLRDFLLVSRFGSGGFSGMMGTIVWYAVWLGISIGGSIILAPLEVISGRLSVQYNTGIILSDDQREADRERLLRGEPVADASGGERVVVMRHDTDKGSYEGFAHCVRQVLREEGARAFLRGWPWTFATLFWLGM